MHIYKFDSRRRIEVRLALIALTASMPMVAINLYLITGDEHRRALSLASTGAALLFSGLIVAIIALGVRRTLNSIAETLDRSIREINAASAQLQRSSQSMADSANDQAAALQETTASLEGIAGMTKRNTRNAHKTNTLTRETRATADAGTAEVRAMNDAMNELKAAGDGIGKIVKTIDEIAFQTNILALNAAVEAARAGAAGMGFGVVADEVRSLARRSADAAKETAARIEGSATRTAQGVQIIDKVAKTLDDIVARTRQVDDLATEVASASSEQSSSIEQLGAAVSQMNQVTQTSAATAEENAAAAEELHAQAESLRRVMGDLAELVGNYAAQAELPEARSFQPSMARASHGATHAPESNGHRTPAPTARKARTATRTSTVAAGRDSIPLDEDFQDF